MAIISMKMVSTVCLRKNLLIPIYFPAKIVQTTRKKSSNVMMLNTVLTKAGRVYF